MTDPGLNQRLKQRSRRSGLMIGLSMALTLMVCVAAFTMIFAQLEPVVSDFVGRGEVEVPTLMPTQPPVAQQAAVAPTAPPQPEATTAPTAPASNAPTAVAQTPTPDPDEFTPDFQITGDGPVNLRPGPGVSSGSAIVALPIGTPLQYLDEEQQTTDPEGDDLGDGDVWMRFRTEDGQEGWIREVDVEEYVP
jgi:hypothetical protein